MTFLLANWKLIAGAWVVLLLAGALYWFGHERYQAGYETARNDARAEQQAANDAAQKAIADIDIKRTKEIEIAKLENDKLRADIRDGTRRLSIRTASCSKQGSGPGVDHGSQRADIDSRDADALVGIANRGDDAIRQLLAAQDVIRALTGE